MTGWTLGVRRLGFTGSHVAAGSLYSSQALARGLLVFLFFHPQKSRAPRHPLFAMIPPVNSLVKYDSPVLVSSTKDKDKACYQPHLRLSAGWGGRGGRGRPAGPGAAV